VLREDDWYGFVSHVAPFWLVEMMQLEWFALVMSWKDDVRRQHVVESSRTPVAHHVNGHAAGASDDDDGSDASWAVGDQQHFFVKPGVPVKENESNLVVTGRQTMIGNDVRVWQWW
jgi:hypothetical protein